MYAGWFNINLETLIKNINPVSLKGFGTSYECLIELPPNFNSHQSPEFIDTLIEKLRQNKYIIRVDYTIDSLLNMINIKLFINGNHDDFIKEKQKVCRDIYNKYLIDNRNKKIKQPLGIYISLNNSTNIKEFNFDHFINFVKSKGFKECAYRYLPYERRICLLSHYDN